MKIIPKYSFEYNKILNPKFTELEQIKNFASIISDKDRFLPLLLIIEQNKEFLEEKLGYKLNDNYEFFMVRAELLKSFSEPITIEYSIFPQEMLLFLLKEIIKITITDRFPDENIREQYVNSFIEYFIFKNSLESFELDKYILKLNEESLKQISEYKKIEIDFENNTMKELIIKFYENL